MVCKRFACSCQLVGLDPIWSRIWGLFEQHDSHFWGGSGSLALVPLQAILALYQAWLEKPVFSAVAESAWSCRQHSGGMHPPLAAWLNFLGNQMSQMGVGLPLSVTVGHPPYTHTHTHVHTPLSPLAVYFAY